MIRLDPSALNKSQRAFLNSDDGYVLFCGGFGSGKSLALTLKLLQLKGENGTLPGLMLAQTYSALYANLIDPLLGLLEANNAPAHLIPRVKGRGSGRDMLIWRDGAVCHLRSAEKPGSYDGLTVAYLLGDEIRHWKKEAYDIAIARVRMKHAKRIQRCFSSTPAMNWMSDEFNAGKASRRIIVCGTQENAHNLPDDYMEQLAESYSLRMQRAVLEGIFTILEGAVYEAFDPNPQTSPWLVDFEPTQTNLSAKKVYLAVDPGYRRSAWLWIAELNDSKWVVFDELMPAEKSDVDCVAMCNAKGWPIDEVWIDTAAKAHQSFEGASTLRAIKELKRRRDKPPRVLTGANREIAFGVDKTRVLLGDDVHPMRVQFAKRLCDYERKTGRGIVRDLAALRYPDMKDGRAVSDVPLKDGHSDHSTDAFRYWAVGRWLCSPHLRNSDPGIRRQAGAGWAYA